MSDLVFSALALAVLVLVSGLGPALVLAGSRPAAAMSAPAVSFLVCASAATVSLLTRTSMVPWLVLLSIAGWALALRMAPRSVGPRSPTDVGWGAVVAVLLVSLLPLVLVSYPATGVDAKSIWWLHAAWFRAGGGPARDAMANPVYEYTHPAYPPLVPGVIASVWHLGHAYDREAALRVSQLVTAYGAAAVGYFTACSLRVGEKLALLVAVGVTWLAWSAKVEVGIQGLVDLTWALFLVVAAVLLLAGSTDKRTIALGALFAGVGAFTKTEGQVAALGLVGLTVLRHRAAWRRAVPAAAVVIGTIGAWAVVIRPNENDRGDWSKLGDLLTASSEVRVRFGLSWSRFVDELGLLVGLGAATVVAIVVLGRLSGTRIRQPGLLSLLLLGAGFVLFTILTFTVRPEAIEFLLSVTAYRTVIFVRLLVLVDLVLALVGVARALDVIGGGEPEPVPERATEATPRPV